MADYGIIKFFPDDSSILSNHFARSLAETLQVMNGTKHLTLEERLCEASPELVPRPSLLIFF